MKFILFFSILICCISCDEVKQSAEPSMSTLEEVVSVSDKIAGVNLEMPSSEITNDGFNDLIDINVGWVAMIPYGYTREGEAKVLFDSIATRWWGESLEGTAECIRIAQKAGLKTMVKPHVWVVGQGWPGDFELSSEKAWKEWESSYRDYILMYARLSESLDVDLLCIGTEYRKAVVERKDFWVKLIKEIRGIYDGPLTYASNWDNYKAVTFWDQLDFIGIDTYFPLSTEKNLSIDELKLGWADLDSKLSAFSEKHNRRIIFTEYGFKSVDYASAPLYNVNKDSLKPNMNNQVVAYNAFFQTVWQQDWMAGGFFWKWHVVGRKGGTDNTRYTPQGKPALDVIRDWYGKVEPSI